MKHEKKRIAVVVNKWWECDPIMYSLLNDYPKARPGKILNWPDLARYPVPHRGQESHPWNKPRATFNHVDNVIIDVWCISDLLVDLPDKAKYQSSSEQKMNRLPVIYQNSCPDLLIAVGTAAYYPPYISNNGSVVMGTKCFMHDGHPASDPNNDSQLRNVPFDRVLTSMMSLGQFKALTDFSRAITPPTPLSKLLFAVKIDPAAKLDVYANCDFVACNTVNVTDYAEYEKKDLETVEAYNKLTGSDGKNHSVETTHGLIRASAIPIDGFIPFMFVSGIVDRYECFDIDVSDPSCPQNTAAALNAGIVLSYVLANASATLGDWSRDE
jgi:hypothetical protein